MLLYEKNCCETDSLNFKFLIIGTIYFFEKLKKWSLVVFAVKNAIQILNYSMKHNKKGYLRI